MKKWLLVVLLALAACAQKPVIVVPGEEVDLALHCHKTKAETDGCVVEDQDAIRVHVLTRKAMCTQ